MARKALATMLIANSLQSSPFHSFYLKAAHKNSNRYIRNHQIYTQLPEVVELYRAAPAIRRTVHKNL